MSEQQPPVFIIVAGPSGAGKTTFINTISDSPANPSSGRAMERIVDGYRVRYDFGQIVVDESLTVRLLAPPAAAQVDLAAQLPEGTLGVILLVSSLDAELPEDVKTLANAYMTRCVVPCIVAATKQDRPGALTLAALRKRLEVPAGCPFVSCDATDRDSVTTVIKSLLHIIIDGLDVGQEPPSA